MGTTFSHIWAIILIHTNINQSPLKPLCFLNYQNWPYPSNLHLSWSLHDYWVFSYFTFFLQLSLPSNLTSLCLSVPLCYHTRNWLSPLPLLPSHTSTTTIPSYPTTACPSPPALLPSQQQSAPSPDLSAPCREAMLMLHKTACLPSVRSPIWYSLPSSALKDYTSVVFIALTPMGSNIFQQLHIHLPVESQSLLHWQPHDMPKPCFHTINSMTGQSLHCFGNSAHKSLAESNPTITLTPLCHHHLVDPSLYLAIPYPNAHTILTTHFTGKPTICHKQCLHALDAMSGPCLYVFALPTENPLQTLVLSPHHPYNIPATQFKPPFALTNSAFSPCLSNPAPLCSCQTYPLYLIHPTDHPLWNHPYSYATPCSQNLLSPLLWCLSLHFPRIVALNCLFTFGSLFEFPILPSLLKNFFAIMIFGTLLSTQRLPLPLLIGRIPNFHMPNFPHQNLLFPYPQNFNSQWSSPKQLSLYLLPLVSPTPHCLLSDYPLILPLLTLCYIYEPHEPTRL